SLSEESRTSCHAIASRKGKLDNNPVVTVFTTPKRRSNTSTLFPYTTLFRSYLLNNQDVYLFPDDLTHLMVASWLGQEVVVERLTDRKSTRLNSSHVKISYAGFCLKKKNTPHDQIPIKFISRQPRDLFRSILL